MPPEVRGTGRSEGSWHHLGEDLPQNPYPLYQRLRLDHPVQFDQGTEAWWVTRYDDVRRVLRESQAFSTQGVASFESTLLGADPPAHTRVRRLAAGALSAEHRDDLEHIVRSRTLELLKPIQQAGKCELITELADPLPQLVIAGLLGIRPEDAGRLRRQTESLVGTGDPTALNDFRRFFVDHVLRIRTGTIRGGVLSELMASGSDDGLTQAELVAFGQLMFVAGTETTRNLIGNTMLAVLDHPSAMAVCREQPEQIPGMIEEALRYDSPVQYVKRRSLQAVRLADTLIPPGALVFACIGSANRDERQFSNPDKFDLSRSSVKHLAFGSGAHYCLGAEIARLEAQVVFKTLFSCLGIPKLVYPRQSIPLIKSPQLRGPARMDLKFR